MSTCILSAHYHRAAQLVANTVPNSGSREAGNASWSLRPQGRVDHPEAERCLCYTCRTRTRFGCVWLRHIAGWWRLLCISVGFVHCWILQLKLGGHTHPFSLPVPSHPALPFSLTLLYFPYSCFLPLIYPFPSPLLSPVPHSSFTFHLSPPLPLLTCPIPPATDFFYNFDFWKHVWWQQI